jgi:hypothetical protein
MQTGVEVNVNDRLWRPTGTAEGVFFLGDKPSVVEQEERVGDVVLKVVEGVSLEMQAMRYLRPCAQSWHANTPGQHGVRMSIELNGVLDILDPGLKAQALASGRPVRHFFASDSRVFDDVAGFVKQLEWHECEPGIYAVMIKDGAKGD